jgi:NADH dehydrogenase FAD-containing subunit
MKKDLVLAGGGHAHMMTLAQLNRFVEKGYSVTVIGPSEYHYYSGMGPGMLGGTYAPHEIRFATKHLVEKHGGTFKLGNVVAIDAEARTVQLDTGEAVSYDVLSCNLGSHVNRDIVSGDMEGVYTVKPIEKLMAARKQMLSMGAQKSIAIGIVGGGPSAVEIAGNIHRLVQSPGIRPAVIRILTRGSIMPHHPAGVRSKAVASLKNRDIEILEDCRVQEIRAGVVVESSGERHPFDILFLATGVKPNAVFERSGLQTGPDGGLLVNRFLQHEEHPEIFGGGDCIYFGDKPLNKVGVYAVRQNPILLHNLLAALDGTELVPFKPQGDYLLIFNLGDGTGIFHKRWVRFNGRLAFKIKDAIDRKFMRTFQAFESETLRSESTGR